MAERPATHEDLSRIAEVRPGSERAFGLVFAAFLAAVGLAPLTAGGAPRWWALAAAGAFAALALAWPRALEPLNRLWFAFGRLLNRTVNPVVMGIIFFLAVTPTALVMRLLGKDPLRLGFDRTANSYWIERSPPGPAPETMRNQF